jgi:predicted transcriptional regulator of viral defense system
MKENTNYSKIQKLFKNNGEFITRADINSANIPSWFLSDFVKRNSLVKVAPGFYASSDFIIDDLFILQKRFPKYIFSGMSALYLHGLTDKIPTVIEVTAPQNYKPSRKVIDNHSILKISSDDKYCLGIEGAKTMFGNIVRTYDAERTICDVIKYRDRYDSETFVKAIKSYIKKVNNQIKLFRYAKELGIEKKVYEMMEVLANEN